MKPENKTFLDTNRRHADTLNRAGYLRGLDGNTRSEMQRIFGEEFQPGYIADLWCPVCVADMVRHLYQRYDTWLIANPEPPAADSLITTEPGSPAARRDRSL